MGGVILEPCRRNKLKVIFRQTKMSRTFGMLSMQRRVLKRVREAEAAGLDYTDW